MRLSVSSTEQGITKNFLNEKTMPTLQITLSEPQQQFVMGRVAELGLERPDQYIEKLLNEEQRQKLDEYYMEKVREGLASGPPTRVTEENRDAFWNEVKEKVREAIDRDEWVAEEEFWKRIDENTRSRRNARKAEAG